MLLLVDCSRIEGFYLALADRGHIIIPRQITARFEHEETVLESLQALLSAGGISVPQLTGIIIVSGPGSFSALRIGLAVFNTIAWQSRIPIAGVNKREFTDYEQLLRVGMERLERIDGFNIIIPEYGSEPNIHNNQTAS